MVMENASFKDFLKEYADIKNLSVKKLSDATGVPERYLEAMMDGDKESLPPSPYIRGYISKLASVLDFDSEEMWRLCKKDFLSENSSYPDRLPSNRFAIKRFDKKILLGGLLGLIIIVYIVWNFNKFIGNPKLELTYPTSENLIVAQPTISIEGRTDSNNKLTINDSEIYVDEDGRFQQEIILDPGLNIIKIKSKKFLGREADITREIIYQPPVEIAAEEIVDDLKQ